MSSKIKRTPVVPRRDEVTVPPPDFRKFGKITFDAKERAELGAWLGEAGWPREAMDVELLEGYLVALLIWPVDSPSGAWLPHIWGEQGWKLPAKLADLQKFNRFVVLIAGFLQELNRRLTGADRFIPILQPPETRPDWRPRTPCRWALGFLRSLQQHAYGLKYRSAAARQAAESIALWASLPSERRTAAELSRAVHTLLTERPTRGPLGPLIHHLPVTPKEPTLRIEQTNARLLTPIKGH